MRRPRPTQGPRQGRPRAAQDMPSGGQSQFGQVQGHQEANLGPTWANLGQLSANLGPTWGQLGAPEAKSDCIFTVFFKVCVKIELSLPRAAPEAPGDAEEAPRAGQERPGAAKTSPRAARSSPKVPKSAPRAAKKCPKRPPTGNKKLKSDTKPIHDRTGPPWD